MSKRALIVAAALAVVGCKVGPDYVAPTHQLPDKFGAVPAASTQPSTRPTADLAKWWDVFDDPILSQLIQQSINENLDLRIAATRIRQAKAARGISESALWPQVNMEADATRSKGSDNGPGAQPGYSAQEQTTYNIAGSAAWELDFFGGNKRGVEAALADIEAAKEARWALQVAMVSEVAINYMELRGNQRQLNIAKKNIKVQRDTLELTQTRFNAGLNNELNVARSKALVASSEASVPPLEMAIARNINRISVLLGKLPDSLKDDLIQPGDMPVPVAEPPVGMPSDLLWRRPDVVMAERQIAAETARVGVATAELYPKFTISGALGSQSTGRDRIKIADIQSGFWSFGPGMTMPIFNAGRIKSQINVQKAEVDVALATYEKTILLAMEEVENSLTSMDKTQLQIESLERAVEANRRAVELTTEIYNKGLQDFQWVLDAQKNLFQADQALSQVKTLQSINLIALYKALGGGWSDCGCEYGKSPE